jgi:hypothetical protein
LAYLERQSAQKSVQTIMLVCLRLLGGLFTVMLKVSQSLFSLFFLAIPLAFSDEGSAEVSKTKSCEIENIVNQCWLISENVLVRFKPKANKPR